MGLHPQCKAFLDTLAAAGGTPLEQLPPAEARAVSKGLMAFGGPAEAVFEIADRVIPGPAGLIPIRVYRPHPDAGRPGLVFFHGGGFVLCDLESHDRQCRALANASGFVVVAVDYRLAPEHKFPAAAEDAYAATQYVATHATELGIDPNRVAVGGDSAGGNLAAVVSLMSRDRGGASLIFQMLIYPMVDVADESPSMQEYAEGHFLTRGALDWFARHYVRDRADAENPYVSPLRAADLEGLPPALVITAECDPVRDQGEAYARRLHEAGVQTELRRYDGMIHPFINLPGVIDTARTALEDAAAALRRAGSGSAQPVARG
jgi:acetyl esterase